MTLTKAIEILSLFEHAASSLPRDDFLEALQLGIQALEWYHESPHFINGCLLEGQTPETEE